MANQKSPTSYEEWVDDYGLAASHSYTKTADTDCRAAFLAGQESQVSVIANLKAAIEKATRTINAIRALV